MRGFKRQIPPIYLLMLFFGIRLPDFGYAFFCVEDGVCKGAIRGILV